MVIKDEKRLKRLKREAEKLESELAIKPYNSWRPEVTDDVKALEKIRYGEDSKDFERYFLWHSRREHSTGFSTGTGSLGKVIMLRDAVKQIKKRISLTKKLGKNALGKFLTNNNLSDTEVFILAAIDLRNAYYSKEALINNLFMYGFEKENIEKCLSDESQLFKNNLIRLENDAYSTTYKGITGLEGVRYTKDWHELDNAKGDDTQGKADYAEIIEPKLSLDDVILPESVSRPLKLGLAQLKHFKTLKKWLSKHYKTNAMIFHFSGPPGVGKTLAAEGIAQSLGKKLRVVNYAKLESCWWGVSTKNIVTVFEQAKKSDDILFFDEADTIVAKRTAVRHSTDRHSNMDTNTLLKEIENFEGTAIFATNLSANLDPAFERRCSLHIHFPIPDAQSRVKIWKLHFGKAPLAEDVKLEEITVKYELSGGLIKQAVVNAARLAVIDGKKIKMCHVLEACELVKNGSAIMKQSCLGG